MWFGIIWTINFSSYFRLSVKAFEYKYDLILCQLWVHTAPKNISGFDGFVSPLPT